jgi:chorismate mutase
MWQSAWLKASAKRSDDKGLRDSGKGMRVMAQDPVLAAFRQSIDNIDAALIFMLAERFKITKAVGEYKAKTALPPADPGREEEQIARMKRLALDADLDPEFSEKFLRFVIDEVIRHHEKIRDQA